MIKKLWKDSLYRNSSFLILNNVITAGLGFVFWLICARLFSTQEVGYATSLIALVGLVSSFSMFGFNLAIIKYLHKFKEQNRLISSCINITALSSIFIGSIVLILIPFISPNLLLIMDTKESFIIFLIFTIVWSLSILTDSIFIAKRKTHIVFIKGIISNIIKIILPIMLTFLGVFGILGSYYMGFTLGIIFAFFLISFKITIDFKVIKKIFKFSFGNYIAFILGMLPTYLLPLIIITRFGPEATAYFSISWMIANFLFYLSRATSDSLLSEGSYKPHKVKFLVKKAYKFSFFLLIPSILLIILFGKFILNLFGTNYANNAYLILIIFAVSSIFVSITNIKSSKANINHNLRKVLLIRFLIAFITISGSLIYTGDNLFIIAIIFGFANMITGVFL